MALYRVIVDPQAKDGYEFRGDNRKFFACRDHQCIVAGVADSGKTVTGCAKLHLTCLSYEASQHAIIRKTYASMPGSVLQTFNRIIKGANVVTHGGAHVSRYTYPNGATVWVGGMDNPDRALSSERDTIYVNQTEELTAAEWETLSTRCTGRAAVVKWPQIYGDCNPGGSKHWIREKAKAGVLKLFTAVHKDNPTIFDNRGNLLPEGRKRLDALATLTGVRRKRLFEGIWATSEGAVYDMFDASIHAKARDAREMQRWYLALDEGYTNPQVILLIGSDSDKRWHIFCEFYVTHRLESDVVAQAKEWAQDVRTAKNCPNPAKPGEFTYPVHLPFKATVEMAACDDAAPGLIASLNAAGVYTLGGKGLIGGNGKVKGGIDKIQDRLKVQADGLPRLTVDPDCVNTINEFESYVWKPEKDVPVDEYNHSMGALRYLSDVLNEPTGAWDSASIRRAASGHERVWGEAIDPLADEVAFSPD